MSTVELITVSRHAPVVVLDRVLTAAQEALDDVGAARVWVDRQGDNLTVLAELTPV
jgi:hypothetical protein